MRMPDGTPFAFWDDTTKYSKVYHVACGHTQASDANPGTDDLPFATINKAASVLQPGEKVIVHEGVYRECVRPARGGAGPDRMIAYEAAPGESVCIKGSEVWRPAFGPSEGYRLKPWGADPATPDPRVWMGELPAEIFVGYNPFLATNMSSEFWSYSHAWTPEEVHAQQLRRGMIFMDGRPLHQVFRITELAENEGAFWVEDPGLRIHLRLSGDADPSGVRFEVTAREQVFAPKQFYLGFIRVSGFRFEHAGDGVPVPQRALVSASRGHHWIIEDNEIRWANAVGLDVGAQTWDASHRERSGSHIIRRNLVANCGICGIAGATGADQALVEDNLIEHIGGHPFENIAECAGLKFHECRGSLFRGNVFRHNRRATGLWLDVGNRNCRITGNVFADIDGPSGGVYIECSHGLNVVDRNVFWHIRYDEGEGRGWAVRVESGENVVIAHNFFGKIAGHAVAMTLGQPGRLINGRVGLSRRNKVLNNVFVCPKRITLVQAADNISDGNLFDARTDAASLSIQYPEPESVLNLGAWQEYYGLDLHGAQGSVEADFNVDSLELTCRVEGAAPTCQPVEAMHEDGVGLLPGPFDRNEWQAGKKRYPRRGC